MNVVRSVRDISDANKAHVSPNNYPVITDKDFPKTIKTLTEFLDKFLGETKIIFGYVI